MIGKSRGTDLRVITHEFNLKGANVPKEIVKELITFQSTGTNGNSRTNNYNKLITQFVLAVSYVQKCHSYAQCSLLSQLQVFHFTAPQRLLLADVTTVSHCYFYPLLSLLGRGLGKARYAFPMSMGVMDVTFISVPLPPYLQFWASCALLSLSQGQISF